MILDISQIASPHAEAKGAGMDEETEQDPYNNKCCEKKPPYSKLTPVDADIEPYVEAFDFVFENDDLRNIAITGAYGSGKSSLISSVKKRYGAGADSNSEKRHRFLTISLTSFDTPIQSDDNRSTRTHTSEIKQNAKADSTQPDTQTNDSEINGHNNKQSEDCDSVSILEGQIINQVIHRIDHKVAPKTRFKKTHRTSWLTAVSTAVYVTFSVLYFLSLANPLFPLFSSAVHDSRSIMTLLWFLFTVVALAALFKKGTLKRLIKRIGFQGNELELFDDKGDSRFDRYMDDIVYMLHESKCDVIVFEDLDRFESIEVFVKLREINELVNSMREQNKATLPRKAQGLFLKTPLLGRLAKGASQGDRPLRFIYLIRDDLFTSKDRTKFFDFIIPVIPYIDFSNSYSELESSFPNQNCKPTPNCLKDVAMFIDDARLLHNAVNEYEIYRRRLFLLDKETVNEEHWNKLFALVVYKNLFPSDFAKLQFDEGYLYSILSSKTKLSAEIKQHFENELDDRKGELEDEVRKTSDKVILEILKSDDELRRVVEECELLASFEQAADLNYIESLGNQNQELAALISSKKGALLNSTEAKEEIENRLRNSTGNPYQRVDDAQKCLNEVDSADLKSLLGLYQNHITADLSKVFQTDDFLETKDGQLKKSRNYYMAHTLVLNGHIDNSFRHYISIFREGDLIAADHEYLMMVSAGDSVEAEREIDNPEALINQMDCSYFSRPGARVYKLVHCLFSKTQDKNDSLWEDKRKVFLESLKGSGGADFIVGFVCSEYYTKELFVESEPLNIDMASLVFERECTASETAKQEYALRLYLDKRYCILDSLEWDTLSNYAVNNSQFLSCKFDWVGDSEINKFIEVLDEINAYHQRLFLFRTIDFKTANRRLLNHVYKHGYYESTVETMRGFLYTQHEITIEEPPINILHAVVTLEDAPIKNKAENDIDTLITETLESEWGEDDELCARWILNNPKVSPKNTMQYISRLSKRLIPKIDKYPEALWNPLLEAKAIIPTLYNASLIYQSSGELNENIANFFCDITDDEIHASSHEDIPNEAYEPLANDLLYSEYISSNTFGKLVNAADYYYKTIDFEKCKTERIVSLVEQKRIEFDSQNYIGVIEKDFNAGVLLILDNIDEFCKLASNEEIALREGVAEEIFKAGQVNIGHAQQLVQLAPNSLHPSDEYSETANAAILEGDLTDEEAIQLVNMWEDAADSLKKQIALKCRELAFQNRSLGRSIPYPLLLQLLSEKNIRLEYRKILFADNINHLDYKQVRNGLCSLGMYHFEQVVSGSASRKKTKPPTAGANSKIAKQLCKHGYAKSWRADNNNENHIWLYGNTTRKRSKKMLL